MLSLTRRRHTIIERKSSMSYAPSSPDLSQLWQATHDQSLAVSIGQTDSGDGLTATFPETAPLLILAQEADAQKRLVLALVAQLLSKCGKSGLRLALLEQPGDQKLTRLLQNYAQTVFTISSQQGFVEAIWYLEGTLLNREKARIASPPWLIVLELSDENALPARVRQALQQLLERGTWAGLFLLLLARQAGAAALSLPDVFAATLVLDTQPAVGSPLHAGLLCVRLYSGTNPTSSVSALAPQVLPADVIILLDRYIPRDLTAKTDT